MLRVERTASDVDQCILYMDILSSGYKTLIQQNDHLNLGQESMYMTKGLSHMQFNEGKGDDIFNLKKEKIMTLFNTY